MPKKPTEAGKPRGPMTAYSLFVRTCREELKKKHPTMQVDYSVIAKRCSEKWKAMNDAEKKRFNDTAEIQRRRYKEEMTQYEQIKQTSLTSCILPPPQQNLQQNSMALPPPSMSMPTSHPHHPFLEHPHHPHHAIQHTTLVPLPSSASPHLFQQHQLQQQHSSNSAALVANKKPPRKREPKKPKDPYAPKKPLSAYFLFCADERPKVHTSQAGMSVSDVARELGIRWKSAQPQLRSKYEQAACEQKTVYQAEMQIYKQQSSTGSSPPQTPQGMGDQQAHHQQQQQQQQFFMNQTLFAMPPPPQQNFFDHGSSSTTPDNILPHEFDLVSGNGGAVGPDG